MNTVTAALLACILAAFATQGSLGQDEGKALTTVVSTRPSSAAEQSTKPTPANTESTADSKTNSTADKTATSPNDTSITNSTTGTPGTTPKGGANREKSSAQVVLLSLLAAMAFLKLFP